MDPRARGSTAVWIGVLAWCAVCGWFAFVQDSRVPLVSLANLGFHELGHLVMYVLPISDVLTAAMGSIMQCAVPLGLAAYFWLRRADPVGAATCLGWASTNFEEASVYIADAPYERLALIGSEHDWAYVLGHLHKLQHAHAAAVVVRGAGLVILLCAVGLAVRALLSTRASDPVAATASTADDRFPMQ